MNYDIIIIGSGPGGYVAAIRAAQLGKKVAVVEKAELGGVCLNWGCIPTKALLKSAQVYTYALHAENYGIKINGTVKPDLKAMVARSRAVAEGMSQGIQYLFKKNKIDLIKGFGMLKAGKLVEVKDEEGKTSVYKAENIILATGARPKELPQLKQDGKKVIGYREALTLSKIPKSMIVVGAGAIGVEFAYFYQSIGTEVALLEFLPNIVPFEDIDVSKQLSRSFKKMKMKVMSEASIESVDTSGDLCKAVVNTKKGKEIIEAEIILSAAGITPNTEGLGLEDAGIEVRDGKVQVNEFYQCNVPGYYAIGDLIPGPALAHVASQEGIICVEKIAGMEVNPLDYENVPGCTYAQPEIASVGMTEEKAKEAGYEVKVGMFPFTASGKANASGNRDGFVKVIFDAKYGEWLGAHMIGENVTEMIAGVVVARKLETTAKEIMQSVHPHPTMSEAIMEAVAAAYGEVIHL